MDDIFGDLGTVIRALGGGGFHAAMEDLLTRAMEPDNYIVIAYSGDRPPVILHRRSSSARVHGELETRYVTALYVLDPFYAAHIDRVPPGAYRLRDIAPDKFRTTSYYSEYYRRTTLVDELAFFAYVENGWTINICLGRDSSSRRLFGKGALNRARRMAPAVAALLERHFAALPIAGRTDTVSVDDLLIRRLREARRIEITRRQAQVAVLLLRGHSSKSIARELGVSWQTVRVFRRQLYARCGISSQAELFALLTPLVTA